jgi:hypothetical protein
MALDMKQLKRMSNSDNSDHVHSLPDGSLTSGAIPAMDNTHAHTYGEGERTMTENDSPDHVHKLADGGVTGVPE